MNILHINTNNEKGAIPKIIKSIVEYSNHKHYVFSPYGGKNIKDTKNRIYKAIYALRARILDVDALIDTRFDKKIEKIINQRKIDLIHLHNPHGYYLNLERLISNCEKRNLPLVWTLHDYWALTGRCASPQAKSCDNYKAQCRECRFKDNYPATWFSNSEKNYKIKNNSFKSKKIYPVCVSEHQRNVFRESNQFSNRLSLINNGVEWEERTEARNTKSNEVSKIGFLSNVWTEPKGKTSLINIVSSLQKMDPLFAIVVGGNCTGVFKGKLEGNVNLVGEITNTKKLNEFFLNIDVFVNLSKIDTFGMVNIEALTNRRPVIVRNIEPYLSLFRDYKVVKFCDKMDNFADILHSAKELLKWCNENKIEANREYNLLRERYSAVGMVRKYDKLYSEVKIKVIEEASNV